MSNVSEFPAWVVKGQDFSWINNITDLDSEIKSFIDDLNINSDELYQAFEFKLSLESRIKLAKARFNYFIQILPFNDVGDYCIIFPPWFNQLDIDEIGLKNRTINTLRRAEIYYLYQLYGKENSSLLKFPTFGQNTLENIKDVIKKHVNQFKEGFGEIYSSISSYVKHDENISQPTNNNLVINKVEIYKEWKNLIDVIEQIIDSFNKESVRFVLKARLGLENESKTLQEVANAHGDLTRERIRQIETKAKRDFNKLFDIASDTVIRFDDIRKDMLLPLTVNSLSLYDEWFNGIEHKPWIIESIINVFDIKNYRVHNYNGQKIIAPGDRQFIDLAVKSTKDYAKNNIEKRISKSKIYKFVENLVGIQTPELIDLVFNDAMQNAIFTNEKNEERLITLGAGLNSFIYSLLYSSPRPLTVNELYKTIFKQFSKEIDERIVRNQAAEVAYLFAPSTYGLIKHLELTDDQITIIQNNVREIMLEQPDRQWHCHEILEVLNEKNIDLFQLINSHKISICLELSDKFVSLGRMIFVLAGENIDDKSKRIDFFRFVEAVLEKSETPMNREEILNQIRNERGLSEYSQILPLGRLISVGKAKWALQDKHLHLTDDDINKILSEIEDILAESNIGLTQDELINLLPENACSNRFIDNPYILFSIATKYKIAKKEDIFLFLKNWEDSRRITVKKAITESLEKHSVIGKFSAKQIYTYAENLYGRKFPREYVNKFILDAGGEYNKEGNYWEIKNA